MDPRARIAAFVIALLVAAGAGYAVGAATDGEPAQVDRGLQAPNRSQPAAPLQPISEPSGGAEDEYQLAP